MAPRQKEIVIYYDFSDVLACASTVSSLSMTSVIEEDDESSTSSQERQPHRPNAIAQYRPSSYNLKLFDSNNYNNVEHKWEKKPFVVRSLSTFCRPNHSKLNKLIHQNRAKLSHAGCWDPEGLVLTDASSPFRSKVYFGVKNASLVPKKMKITHLSGTWLSKVYVGKEEYLLDWVDSVALEVQEKYNTKRALRGQWLAFHPTQTQHQYNQTVVTFFIKVSD